MPYITNIPNIATELTDTTEFAVSQGATAGDQKKITGAVIKSYMTTAAGKTAADDIGAATGATTALKLAGLTSNASTTQEGVSEFATAAEIVTGTDTDRSVNVKQLRDSADLAGMWLIKRTKMPDGATAVYSQDAWATTDGWTSNGSISVSGGELSAQYNMYKSIAGIWGKTLIIRLTAVTSPIAQIGVGTTGGVNFGVMLNNLQVGQYAVAAFRLPAANTNDYVVIRDIANAGTFKVNWIWIGDYSYLSGSLSEEAARIADQLGDTAGVGVAASGSLLLSTAVPSANATVSIGGKLYTFVTALSLTRVEGEVLIGATINETMINLRRAINRGLPVFFDYNGSTPVYNIAACNPLVYAVESGATVNLTAGYTSGDGTTLNKTAGLSGNQITLVASTSPASNITVSGSTLSGGIDDVGDKIHTQLQTMPATTDKYGAAKLAADGGTTAGTAVQATDGRLQKAPATYTPTPYFGGVSDDGTYTITANNYTYAGKLTHCEGRIAWTAKGTKTGSFSIALPRNAPSATAIPCGRMTVNSGGSGVPASVVLTVNDRFAYAQIQGATVISGLTDASFTNTTEIRFSIDYIDA